MKRNIIKGIRVGDEIMLSRENQDRHFSRLSYRPRHTTQEEKILSSD